MGNDLRKPAISHKHTSFWKLWKSVSSRKSSGKTVLYSFYFQKSYQNILYKQSRNDFTQTNLYPASKYHVGWLRSQFNTQQ